MARQPTTRRPTPESARAPTQSAGVGITGWGHDMGRGCNHPWLVGPAAASARNLTVRTRAGSDRRRLGRLVLRPTQEPGAVRVGMMRACWSGRPAMGEVGRGDRTPKTARCARECATWPSARGPRQAGRRRGWCAGGGGGQAQAPGQLPHDVLQAIGRPRRGGIPALVRLLRGVTGRGRRPGRRGRGPAGDGRSGPGPWPGGPPAAPAAPREHAKLWGAGFHRHAGLRQLHRQPHPPHRLWPILAPSAGPRCTRARISPQRFCMLSPMAP
jgi:hypothetical protein